MARAKWQTFRPLPSDADGRPIQGGTIISDIINMNIATGSWTRVYATAPCKSIRAKLECGHCWRLSFNQSEYITVIGEYVAPYVSTDENQTLFYAQAAHNIASLQVLLMD